MGQKMTRIGSTPGPLSGRVMPEEVEQGCAIEDLDALVRAGKRFSVMYGRSVLQFVNHPGIECALSHTTGHSHLPDAPRSFRPQQTWRRDSFVLCGPVPQKKRHRLPSSIAA